MPQGREKWIDTTPKFEDDATHALGELGSALLSVTVDPVSVRCRGMWRIAWTTRRAAPGRPRARQLPPARHDPRVPPHRVPLDRAGPPVAGPMRSPQVAVLIVGMIEVPRRPRIDRIAATGAVRLTRQHRPRGPRPQPPMDEPIAASISAKRRACVVLREPARPRWNPASCRSGRQDLNLRPPGPQPGALPDCATPRYVDLERATGIEPALEAWKASVQPQHFARKRPAR